MRKFSKITFLFVVALIISVATLSFAAEEKKAAEGTKAAEKPAEVVKKKAPKKYKVGDVVDDFKLKDGITKADISFNRDIKGAAKVVAISFMTTSCSACKAELNLLSDLTNKYGEEFKAFAIAVDINGEKTVPGYDANFGFNVSYLLDPDFSIPHKFGFTYTPSLVLIDKSGKVLYLKGGYSPSSDPDSIIKEVKNAL